MTKLNLIDYRSYKEEIKTMDLVISELKSKCYDIERFVINNNYPLRKILINRYLNGMTIEEISKNIGYSSLQIEKFIQDFFDTLKSSE